MARKPKGPKEVEAQKYPHKRVNVPTAELESAAERVIDRDVRAAFERRDPDLDPQLVWRGKDIADWSDLVVPAPPLYIQEKVHPKVIVDDLMRQSKARRPERDDDAPDLFADFNGVPKDAQAEFYAHPQNWSNRMILGDSLQVMASLAEREGLRGKVQCIYIDPPYGIKFNSNFQWSTTTTDVRDGKADHITREPEQVKAFRDTWRDGIHSYLTYLRDRLTAARDLLTESGSVFVQIGDENVHRVRALMDEVFGTDNFVSEIVFAKTTGQSSNEIAGVADYIIWYSKTRDKLKYRGIFNEKVEGEVGGTRYAVSKKRSEKGDDRLTTSSDLTSQSPGTRYPVQFDGGEFFPVGYWKTEEASMPRLLKADRIEQMGKTLRYTRFLDDYPVNPINNLWTNIGGVQSRADPKIYVVQTSTTAIQRCILMTTDPGDLVLDPTCGSGTTATVAEQWGRRWITVDTSRVALALARARIMGARYPYYLLADSAAGRQKEAEVTRKPPRAGATSGDIRQGFVYERVPHITLKAIANNAEIDVIWERLQPAVEAALADLNRALAGHAEPFEVTAGGRKGQMIDFTAGPEATVEMPSGERAPAAGFMEWEVPREAPAGWPGAAVQALAAFWDARIARQREIDASIAAAADHEYLYDRPYQDTGKVRVAGPFTVESLSPHRTVAVDEDDELIGLDEDPADPPAPDASNDFAAVILDNLKTAGVQFTDRANRIRFTSLQPRPGDYVCARATYEDEDGAEQQAGVFIGPEFGTVGRQDLVLAARETADLGYDVLIACAFSFDAHSSEFAKLGGVPVLKARMNADLHMAEDFRKTDKANLFVVFGEPDIEIMEAADDRVRVKIRGIDVFKPQTGEVESGGPESIACWFIDTNYDDESFFVRHAYFLGAAADPYKALKTTLKAEIDAEAWASLNSDTSRPFDKPATGRIAVKVINHLGDEVMKVYGVG
ncbi:site-specific DNA-methyltransferase [Minwuia thermotolerans]|uniref:site-specific DNA-methyltransferase (adenine-specific) n=1 Tax=Minwuia thermotolerans TaxID=2056226 RepID=A0A2M9FXY6_9PROT|nr:site-specific DNA-methyltransferase [Minwuia thermotolerans]PJK28320.1 site-specific DNA-methyltransferase [Minwuia thermotolerans]